MVMQAHEVDAGCRELALVRLSGTIEEFEVV